MKILWFFLLMISSMLNTGDEAGKIISQEEIKHYPESQIRTTAGLFGLGNYSEKIKFSVNAYKVVYTTVFKDSTIRVSGLLLSPETNEKLPIISIQHGTVFGNNEVPSAAPYAYSEYILMASLGYHCLLPDYIGYQASASFFHPYYDKEYSAATVTDFIQAVKSSWDNKKIPYENEIFLSGYSEGGYVTLCALDKIQQEKRIKVGGTFAGAGGYDLHGILRGALINKDEYPAPAYLVFILTAYNKTYDWNRKHSDFFNVKTAGQIDHYFDGKQTFSSVNDRLPKKLNELFSPAFHYSLGDTASEHALKKALVSNSVLHFIPDSPLYLYHGTEDEIVPLSTSEITYQHFMKSGAPGVFLKKIEGGNHSTSYFPMYIDFLKWLEKRKEN